MMATTILELQTLSNFVENGGENRYYQTYTELPMFVVGHTYHISWDGVDYTCVAKVVDSVPAIGNEGIFYGDGTDEPFMMGIVPGAVIGEEQNVLMIYSTDPDTTEHIVGITVEEAAEEVYFGFELPFTLAEGMGLYLWQTYGDTETYPDPKLFELIAGETYRIVWDGITYDCVAQYVESGGIVGTGIGNFGIAGLGEDTGELFLLGVFSDGSNTACYATEEAASHTIILYRLLSNGHDIVLKNYSGVDVTYENVDAVMFDTPDGDTQVYTRGELITGVYVGLDLKDGNQTVTTPEGTLANAATIIKPATLLPENIRNGVTIAGVEGEFIGDTEELALSLSMSEGDMVVTPTAEGKVISQVTITKPETLIPENIAEGVEIGGVVGTFVGGGAIEGVYKVTFYSWDGQLLLERYCYQGDDCPCPVAQGRVTVSTTRDNSDKYIYGDWCGWAKAPDVAAQTDVLLNVTEEMVLYAAYEIAYENIIPEQTLAFSYNSDDKAYTCALLPGAIVTGQSYVVVWDGTPYTITCKTGAGGTVNGSITISTTAYLGDPTQRKGFFGYSIVWKISSTGHPFYIGQYNSDKLSIFTQQTAASHTVWVYK